MHRGQQFHTVGCFKSVNQPCYPLKTSLRLGIRSHHFYRDPGSIRQEFDGYGMESLSQYFIVGGKQESPFCTYLPNLAATLRVSQHILNRHYIWNKGGLVMPRRRTRFHHRAFSPKEPAIVVGNYVGRKLSELSDEELNHFLLVDARRQSSNPVVITGWLLSPWCPDLSQYWFAKYELERRRPEAHRDAAASLKITSDDSKPEIARKLAEYGFRAASRKYHPDRGGETSTMQRVNEARQFALDRLRA
jgi:hypothetical protein